MIFWYGVATGLKERARGIRLMWMVSKVKESTYSARQGSALSSHIVCGEYPLHPREDQVLVMRSEVDFNPTLVQLPAVHYPNKKGKVNKKKASSGTFFFGKTT